MVLFLALHRSKIFSIPLVDLEKELISWTGSVKFGKDFGRMIEDTWHFWCRRGPTLDVLSVVDFFPISNRAKSVICYTVRQVASRLLASANSHFIGLIPLLCLPFVSSVPLLKPSWQRFNCKVIERQLEMSWGKDRIECSSALLGSAWILTKSVDIGVTSPGAVSPLK